jgi:hypothetical protein
MVWLSLQSADDVLIDNQAAKEGYQLFEKVKPEEHSELVMPPSKVQKASADIVDYELKKQLQLPSKSSLETSVDRNQIRNMGFLCLRRKLKLRKIPAI